MTFYSRNRTTFISVLTQIKPCFVTVEAAASGDLQQAIRACIWQRSVAGWASISATAPRLSHYNCNGATGTHQLPPHTSVAREAPGG